MPKQIKWNRDAQEALFSGVKQLADAVSVTIGPKGRNVILDKAYGGHSGCSMAITMRVMQGIAKNK